MEWRNRYLNQYKGRWYYRRRVPTELSKLDQRGTVKVALKTDSLTEARVRRDALSQADDHYWASLESAMDPEAAKDVAIRERYASAKKRALARGFIYAPMTELVVPDNIEDLVERVLSVGEAQKPTEIVAEALLGNVPVPSISIEQAFEFYCEKLALGETANKSPAQLKAWRKAKSRAITNFVAVIGNLDMDKITRVHAKRFYEWWGERLRPKDGTKPLRPNSANRDLGTLRKLYRQYWEYEGQDERDNPFKKLRFADNGVIETPAFDNAWIRDKFLTANAFDGLNADAALIVYALIETGCRPSEIANLKPENIRLSGPVPYIQIRARQDREIKTQSSNRDIPLVGVSLEAMKLRPKGFPRYHDKGATLSALLMKYFKNNALLPTERHKIYSLRHSFEKRMLEDGLDYGLRCILMGHQNTRPSYGDGGSLAFRREELLKIQHPLSNSFRTWLYELT